MTADDCLAKFSVAALIGAPDAMDRAEAAIDDYLSPHRFAPLAATAALYELQDAFAALKIDSSAARSIREKIDDRLRQLSEAINASTTRTAPPEAGGAALTSSEP